MTVVHAECHFIQIGVTIVLSYGSPSMPECVETIAVFLFYPHITANRPNAMIHIRIKAIKITVSLMEIEQEIIIIVRKILVKG